MTTAIISLVVAYSTNRVIGRDNTLPWRLKADLAHFKRVTIGHPIIMGRKTWESLGRPLPDRPNIVISRNPDYRADGATVYSSLDEALAAWNTGSKVCVIGGEDVFRQALPLAHEIIATEVHAVVDGDTFFPVLDTNWLETDRQPQPPEGDLAFDFVTYLRPPVA